MIQGLPEKLRILRTKSGFSQREIAERLGVSASIISGYETGERTPSVENLLSLSYIYRCTTDYLLGRETASVLDTIYAEGLSGKQIQLIQELVNTIKMNK